MDWERFKLGEGARGDLGSDPGTPRHKPGETFIRGPIPWPWLKTATQLDGAGFAVSVGVWYLARRYGRNVRSSIPELAESLGVGRTSIKSGLRLAEAAGLVSVERIPGRKLSLGLRSISGPGRDSRSLRGPIPFVWWRSATRLGGTTLQAGAVCWAVAGWERSAEFTVELNAWSELGLTRFAMARGLRKLDVAGLIAIENRPGRSPVVRLNPVPDRPV